jgi:metallo-beta-lactamase family protein
MNDFSALINDRFHIETVIPSRGDTYSVTAESPVEALKTKDMGVKYSKLALIDLIAGLRDEFDELNEMLKNNLKQEVADSRAELLYTKLKNLEKSISETLKS